MSKYSTQQMLRRKKIRRYWRIGLSLSFLIVMLYGVSFWSGHESVEINEVRVSGNKYISTEKVQEKYEEVVSGKIAFMISKKNFVFLPREVISKKIERELSVSSAFVRIGEDINIVEIEIMEYEPWALWCSDTARKDCYFVNEKGLAFFKAPEFVIEDLIYIQKNLETENNDGSENETENSHGEILGQKYSDETLFKKFVTVNDLLKRINISIKSISTEDNETFVLQTKTGPELYMDKRDNPLEIVNNLKTTLEQESIHENQFKNLEYIDLRFEGKVFYKIK
jgi:cell division septal protein FtsQ